MVASCRNHQKFENFMFSLKIIDNQNYICFRTVCLRPARFKLKLEIKLV